MLFKFSFDSIMRNSVISSRVSGIQYVGFTNLSHPISLNITVKYIQYYLLIYGLSQSYFIFNISNSILDEAFHTLRILSTSIITELLPRGFSSSQNRQSSRLLLKILNENYLFEKTKSKAKFWKRIIQGMFLKILGAWWLSDQHICLAPPGWGAQFPSPPGHL